MFVEFHILQSFPPSNPNRDDANNPKDALFGGVRRARISSQSFKRAMLNYFKDMSSLGRLAIRTRYVRDRWLLPALVNAGKDAEEAKRVLDLALPAFFVKFDSKNKGKSKRNGLRKEPPERWETALFLAPEEGDYIVSRLLDNWEVLARGGKDAEKRADKIGKAFQDEFKAGKKKGELPKYLTPDIALFGRMMADAPTSHQTV